MNVAVMEILLLFKKGPVRTKKGRSMSRKPDLSSSEAVLNESAT